MSNKAKTIYENYDGIELKQWLDGYYVNKDGKKESNRRLLDNKRILYVVRANIDQSLIKFGIGGVEHGGTSAFGPALTFYQFIATGITTIFNGGAAEDLDYSSMALDVSSSSSGYDISYIANSGTFQFLTAGVYHISIFIQLQAVNSNALRFQARLLKNGSFLTSSSIYDGDSNILARDANITIIQNMAFGETLTLAGYAFGSNSNLQWFGSGQTRMSVIKLT